MSDLVYASRQNTCKWAAQLLDSTAAVVGRCTIAEVRWCAETLETKALSSLVGCPDNNRHRRQLKVPRETEDFGLEAAHGTSPSRTSASFASKLEETSLALIPATQDSRLNVLEAFGQALVFIVHPCTLSDRPLKVRLTLRTP